MSLTDHQRQLLDDGIERHDKITRLHTAGNADAKLLQGLVGMFYTKLENRYQITQARYGYDGYIKAYGRRVLRTGKLSRYSRDIGAITPGGFEE